jgi:hypothetical protein
MSTSNKPLADVLLPRLAIVMPSITISYWSQRARLATSPPALAEVPCAASA